MRRTIDNQQGVQVANSDSMVGAINGNLMVSAGSDVHVTGSTLYADIGKSQSATATNANPVLGTTLPQIAAASHLPRQWLNPAGRSTRVTKAVSALLFVVPSSFLGTTPQSRSALFHLERCDPEPGSLHHGT